MEETKKEANALWNSLRLFMHIKVHVSSHSSMQQGKKASRIKYQKEGEEEDAATESLHNTGTIWLECRIRNIIVAWFDVYCQRNLERRIAKNGQ